MVGGGTKTAGRRAGALVTRHGWVAAVSIAVAAVLLACTEPPEVHSDSATLDAVLAEPPPRVVEARLAGMRWSRRRDPARADDAPSAAELEFEGKLGAILRGNAATPEAIHARGVARLLTGNGSEALPSLEHAVRLRSASARMWSDLSAARHAVAAALQDPSRLPAALAAADRALQLSPELPAAHFNRALILTRIGVRNEAMREWRAAMDAEQDPAWREEIRERLQALDVAPVPPLTTELEAALTRARAGDDSQLREVVRRRVEDVRMVSETVMLASWAEAAGRGADGAERLLADLRLIARLLAETNGDAFMADVVANIDAAHAPGRTTLAKACLAYRDARLHYRDHLAGSDAQLRGAAARFAAVDSPLRFVARYYAANATFDRNEVEDAREMLEELLQEIDPRRYRSLAAGATKQLGMYYGFRGMWSASLVHLDRARVMFDEAGERVNAAFTEAIVGEVNDRIGQFQKGWRHRSAALQVLSASEPSSRSLAVLVGSVHAEILREDYESALSLLTITREEADRVGDTVLTAEMLVRRARVLLAARGSGESRDSLVVARAAAEKIADPRTKRRVVADIDLVEGQTLLRTDPCRAVAVLTPSVELYEATGLGMLLPGAYLERGRAHLGCGNAAKALADYRRGLEEVERQRANVATDVRTTMFDVIPDLISETVDLLLTQNRERDAYEVVERARARTLIEALGVRTAEITPRVEQVAASLPTGGVLIEYVLLPRDVAVFCIRRSGMTAVRLKTDPSRLRAQIDELGVAIDTRKPLGSVQQLAAAVHAQLIGPLRPAIGQADVLYLVPDRFLYATPFAALFDRDQGQYLIEQHRLVIAPSGAFMLRRRPPANGGRVLIVSDPLNESAGAWLRAARHEADAIQRLYRGAKRIEGSTATIENFIAAARDSRLIHYAGHAGVDDAGGGFLPLARSHQSDGRLDAAAISRLSLRKTALVILSACATMRGTASRVEGMPSVSRAFLTAGVPVVLGMLWEIEDEAAARLLLAFHERLRGPATASDALRETQRAFIRSSDAAVSHPASWAAAELLGVD